jgi:hypothetical protein
VNREWDKPPDDPGHGMGRLKFRRPHPSTEPAVDVAAPDTSAPSPDPPAPFARRPEVTTRCPRVAEIVDGGCVGSP